MAKRKLGSIFSNQKGFSLMEVMIAISIFTVFITVFITGQSYNLIDSGKLKDEILMKDIAENLINEIIINPPELRDSLTLSKETKDVVKNENYQTTVEYKKFYFPDVTKVLAEDKNKNEPEDAASEMNNKKILKVIQENMEKIIWQVEVTVKNKTNQSSFGLSTWLYNQNADVQIGSF